MASEAQPASTGNLDFARALTYIKDDPQWLTKLLIGSLMVLASMILIGVPFLLGYYQRTIKRTFDGEAYPLPDWDDWGGFFMDGLKVLALMFAHVMAFMLPVMGCFCGLGALMSAGQHAGDGAGGALAAVGVLGMVVVYGVIFIVALALSIYLPAAQTRLAITDNLAAAFSPGANVAFIRRNPMNYLLSLVVMLVSNFIAQFGVLLLCVGILPASVWAYTAFTYALGETARRDPAFH